MAKNHTTFDALQAEILKRTQKRLEGATGNIIKRELHKNSQAVEGWFSRPSGGIGDPDNIVGETTVGVDSVELIVKNITRPNTELPEYTGGVSGYDPSKDTGTSFTEWLETPLWKELPIGSHITRPARPIVEPTQNAVNTSLKDKIVKSIEVGFK